jgi:pyruvate kinase
MKSAERKSLQRLAAKLQKLRADMLMLEDSLLGRSLPLHEDHRRSACNLVHYLALRQQDIRDLQTELANMGLSSLGRTEGHVLSAIETLSHVLSILLGREVESSLSTEAPVTMGEGSVLLDRNSEVLLGHQPSGRKVRIMVTMSTEAATDYGLVRDLLQSGMDCMRINCAHDNPEVWLGMIRNLQNAREETGRPCRIEMDLAGPKLRTGPLEPGPAVIRCHPRRDESGHVTQPARIRLTSAGECCCS